MVLEELSKKKVSIEWRHKYHVCKASLEVKLPALLSGMLFNKAGRPPKASNDLTAGGPEGKDMSQCIHGNMCCVPAFSQKN